MPVEGAKEMIAALKSLGKKGTGCVRKAERDAAKISLAACIAAAPSVTGTTKEALKVRAGRRKRNRVSMTVQLGQEFFQGKAFYAAFNLFGHHIGKRKSHNPKQQARYEKLTGITRKFIPGDNWMKRAWDSVAGEAAATWEQRMKGYLEEAIAGKGSEE